MHEELLKYVEENNIELIEIPLHGKLKGLYGDNIIAINNKLETSVEKACILAEELGHYHTSSGNILDQTDIRNKKQEKRARCWSYEKLVDILDLINAFKYGINNRYELAEYLDVTEEFLEDTIAHYYRKYGTYCEVGNYVVYFNPLAVLEVWKYK